MSDACENCDGRKCMGCVCREYDHDCADDCPVCCAGCICLTNDYEYEHRDCPRHGRDHNDLWAQNHTHHHP